MAAAASQLEAELNHVRGCCDAARDAAAKEVGAFRVELEHLQQQHRAEVESLASVVRSANLTELRERMDSVEAKLSEVKPGFADEAESGLRQELNSMSEKIKIDHAVILEQMSQDRAKIEAMLSSKSPPSPPRDGAAPEVTATEEVASFRSQLDNMRSDVRETHTLAEQLDMRMGELAEQLLQMSTETHTLAEQLDMRMGELAEQLLQMSTESHRAWKAELSEFSANSEETEHKILVKIGAVEMQMQEARLAWDQEFAALGEKFEAKMAENATAEEEATDVTILKSPQHDHVDEPPDAGNSEEQEIPPDTHADGTPAASAVPSPAPDKLSGRLTEELTAARAEIAKAMERSEQLANEIHEEREARRKEAAEIRARLEVEPILGSPSMPPAARTVERPTYVEITHVPVPHASAEATGPTNKIVDCFRKSSAPASNEATPLSMHRENGLVGSPASRTSSSLQPRVPMLDLTAALAMRRTGEGTEAEPPAHSRSPLRSHPRTEQSNDATAQAVGSVTTNDIARQATETSLSHTSASGQVADEADVNVPNQIGGGLMARQASGPASRSGPQLMSSGSSMLTSGLRPVPQPGQGLQGFQWVGPSSGGRHAPEPWWARAPLAQIAYAGGIGGGPMIQQVERRTSSPVSPARGRYNPSSSPLAPTRGSYPQAYPDWAQTASQRTTSPASSRIEVARGLQRSVSPVHTSRLPLASPIRMVS
eukprot:gnl/TRDRNA2_/TRDRNA2_87031_c1_seq1.p1 gnl/TRDRNA2_/TRDRNA2_87031_c1~~gnl/TRDRNA2_/TRDRNA2_87031_c1_seq1.p1  ORF type:complete len:740 (+),score=152.91 gnl/TRDRNA2_/TRDRNA2_87031_c1_seq1:84-2222(+)